MLILAALAFVAVVGLAPVWATVIGRALESAPQTPETALSLPTPTSVAAAATPSPPSEPTPTGMPLVTVPNLVGQELDAAEQQAHESGLGLQVSEERYHPTVPASHILSHVPEQGAQVPAGSQISAVVSLGAEPLIMPTVVGFPAAVKQLELQDMGLVVAITETSSLEPSGLIVFQDPSAGSQVRAGATVTLTISNGMPGQIEANLDDKLLLVSCELNSTTFQPGDTAQVVVTWRVLNPMPDSYKTFIHVTDAGGRIVTQLDAFPLQGRQPTDTWAVGQEVVDPYNILLPQSLPPGMYALQIGMYKDNSRLPVLDPGLARERDDALIVRHLTINGN
jgi:hypothetical protein